MARAPSIRLRAARLNGRIMERMERKMDADPSYIPDVKETQMLLNVGKLDAVLRDRVASKEEEEDAESSEKAKQAKAKDLVARLTGALKDQPTATAFRGEDDTDSEP